MPLFSAPDIDAPVLSQFSLKNKIAIVTGGSRGIGLEVVRGLAEAGADVAFIYKSSPSSASTASEISQQTGVRVQAYQGDVSDRKAIMSTIARIVQEFGHGRLDIMVANAGVCSSVAASEYDEETWREINSVNYDGVMWTAQAAGKVFREQGRGSLIITASVSALLINVPQTQAAYNASKAAVLQLAKGLAVEWAGFARVNCVSPGYILTESKFGDPFLSNLLFFYLIPIPFFVEGMEAYMIYYVVVLKQPKERMDIWLAQIPGRRLCKPQELKGVST